MVTQFGRVLRVIIGRSETREGLLIDDLHMSFSVQRTRGSEPNKASVKIFNMKASTRQQIRDEFDRIHIEAGYKDHQDVIFAGNIRQLTHGREGPDNVSMIEAADGDRSLRTGFINRTFDVGMTPADKVKAIIADLDIGTGNLSGLDGASGLKRPESISEPVKSYFDNLANTYDCRWSVQNELIEFVSNDKPLSHTASVKSKDTGLIGIPEPQNDGSVQAKCLLDPALRPNGLVQIISGFTDTARGEADEKRSTDLGGGFYRITELEQSGSNYSEEWYSVFKGSKVEDGRVTRSGPALQY